MSTLLTTPRVAYQGEPGAFSEAAAIELLGSEITLVPRSTFANLFSSLDEGVADYALVPIENTLVGPIHPAVELYDESALVVVREVKIRIRQQLIGCPGAVFEEIETVESHPAALGQCGRFLAAHPHLKPIATDDTAGSVAEIIKSGDRRRAAIAGTRAALIYGGCVLKHDIEDNPQNYTRFLLLTQSATRTAVTAGLV